MGRGLPLPYPALDYPSITINLSIRSFTVSSVKMNSPKKKSLQNEMTNWIKQGADLDQKRVTSISEGNPEWPFLNKRSWDTLGKLSGALWLDTLESLSNALLKGKGWPLPYPTVRGSIIEAKRPSRSAPWIQDALADRSNTSTGVHPEFRVHSRVRERSAPWIQGALADRSSTLYYIILYYIILYYIIVSCSIL